MNRFLLGFCLVTFFAIFAFAQAYAQAETSESDSSVSSAQASPNDEVVIPVETADDNTNDNQAVGDAEEMDQLIQTISDSNDAEEAAYASETADASETDDATKTDQSTESLTDDSDSATGANEDPGTIEEAEEMDQLIQVLVKDDSSTGEEAKVDQDSETADEEPMLNLSAEISDELIDMASAEADQEYETLNQTESMGQLIQLLVDSGGNNSSTDAQSPKSIKVNDTETGQTVQMPADTAGAVAEMPAEQAEVEIQEMTESMDVMIETLASSDSLSEALAAESPEIVEEPESESVGQLIEILADDKEIVEGDDGEGSNDDFDVVNEGDILDGILALEKGEA